MTEHEPAIITLANYSSKLAPFPPASTTNHLYGLVDMGSNGIRFSISDLSPPASRLLTCVWKERVGISLYDALHEATPESKPFYFSSAIISTVSQKLLRFSKICKGYSVPQENISVFATEAMRTAKNQDAMLASIYKESGLNVSILSPEMESLFGAMGARSGFADVDGLFMDLGGGSVQMTYLHSSPSGDEQATYHIAAAEAATSLPFGAAKLSDALKAEESARSAKAELNIRMASTFSKLKERFPRLKTQAESKAGVSIYFCGGGFRGYGSMLMHTDPIQPYPIPAIGGYTTTGARFREHEEMSRVNDAHEGKIHGLSKRRRAQFPAIITVVQALVSAIPAIKEVTFCAGGNREGVLFTKLPLEIREAHPLLSYPKSSLTRTVPPNSARGFSQLLRLSLPQSAQHVFSNDLLYHVATNLWSDLGGADAAKALHAPISGATAGLPGLDHYHAAMLSLTMCARWGNDIGPIDRPLFDSLRTLVGSDTAWLCDYLGTVGSVIEMIFAGGPCPAAADAVAVGWQAEESDSMGKKGKKSGINLTMYFGEQIPKGLEAQDLVDMFARVGKGLHLGRKVAVDVGVIPGSGT